jgi:hypothetical protein
MGRRTTTAAEELARNDDAETAAASGSDAQTPCASEDASGDLSSLDRPARRRRRGGERGKKSRARSSNARDDALARQSPIARAVLSAERSTELMKARARGVDDENRGSELPPPSLFLSRLSFCIPRAFAGASVRVQRPATLESALQRVQGVALARAAAAPAELEQGLLAFSRALHRRGYGNEADALPRLGEPREDLSSPARAARVPRPPLAASWNPSSVTNHDNAPHL